MSIRTAEQLIDKIDRELSWRRLELHDLKTIAASSDVSNVRKRVLYRTGVALLYAHWEGFIKCTGTYYLDFVSHQRLPINQLKNNFVTLIYKKRVNDASLSNKYSIFADIADSLINNSTARARVPYKSIIDTQSNLSSKVFKEIIWCLGLDYSLFASKEYLIDSRLVNQRNHIAHGEEIFIGKDEFIEMVDEVFWLINTFKDEISNSVALDKFKKY